MIPSLSAQGTVNAAPRVLVTYSSARNPPSHARVKGVLAWPRSLTHSIATGNLTNANNPAASNHKLSRDVERVAGTPSAVRTSSSNARLPVNAMLARLDFVSRPPTWSSRSPPEVRCLN